MSSLRQIRFRDGDDLYIIIIKNNQILNCQWHTQHENYGKYQNLDKLPLKAKTHIKEQLQTLGIQT